MGYVVVHLVIFFVVMNVIMNFLGVLIDYVDAHLLQLQNELIFMCYWFT